MISIVNYGSGNVSAISSIYRKLSIQHEIVTSSKELSTATKIILPGVGSFDMTMKLLQNADLIPTLSRKVLIENTPVLGICVGMQIMATMSDEGDHPGLGWFEAEVRKLNTAELTNKPSLPHLGWNSVRKMVEHPILTDIDLETGFYFLHSYAFQCKSPEDILLTSQYGSTFPSAVMHANIFGFQFHPEKSHGNGVQLFRNFARI